MAPENKLTADLEITIDQIRTCISSTLNIKIDDLSAKSSIGEFSEWDSLGHITLYFTLQEVFEVSIPLKNAGTIRSVEDWALAIRLETDVQP